MAALVGKTEDAVRKQFNRSFQKLVAFAESKKKVPGARASDDRGRAEEEKTIVEGFVERLLDGRRPVDTGGVLRPSILHLREAFEGKYEVVRAVEEGFREDGLAGAEIG